MTSGWVSWSSSRLPLRCFAGCAREARAAVLFLGEFVALHHRPHRAIEQDDALAEKGFERMNGGGVHGEAAINDKVRGLSNKQIDVS